MHLFWFEALKSKSVPLESHNQSVLAVLNHWFSGEPVRALAFGYDTLKMGPAILSPIQIQILGMGILVALLGVVLAWILNPSGRGGLAWIGVSIALTIIPSHLIWKPYLVFGIPAALYVASKFASTQAPARFPNTSIPVRLIPTKAAIKSPKTAGLCA